MRSDAICAAVKASLLNFINIKELPQIMDNKIKIPQLIIFSCFTLCLCLHKHTLDTREDTGMASARTGRLENLQSMK